jgi:hypothetical protein
VSVDSAGFLRLSRDIYSCAKYNETWEHEIAYSKIDLSSEVSEA